MFENNLNNEFVDTNNAVADTVNDFDDFYDDEPINNDFSSLSIDDFSEAEPTSSFGLDSADNDDFINSNESLSQINFNNIVDGTPTETSGEVKDDVVNEETVFNEVSEDKNDDLSLTEEVKDDFFVDNNIEDELKMKEEESKEETSVPSFSSLTADEMDKMIEEDEKKDESLDDSYVLSNFDVLFDSLYNDVNGANNFISDLIEQKKNVNLNEASLKDDAEKLLKEKEEFAKYMKAQKESIEEDKRQCNEFIKTQKDRLQNEEDQFNKDMAAAKNERELAEETLKVEEQKLETEKEQFADYKKIEEQKLESQRQKLETEKEHFEKEKQIELEKIKSEKRELEIQKEQFAKTKELEEKKLELESQNLSQSCAKFKELVSQFNSGFQQLPEDK